MPLAGPQQEPVVRAASTPFLSAAQACLTESAAEGALAGVSSPHSEVLDSEQVVVHCVPFPNSLTGAELEINRLLGMVWRNVSKKKAYRKWTENQNKSPPRLGPPPLSTWPGTRGPASASCCTASRKVLLCGQPKTCHPWPRLLGYVLQITCDPGTPGTVSDAEPGTGCTKPSKRLPLLHRSKDRENCHVLLPL